MEIHSTNNSQITLKMKNKVERLTFNDFKTYHKASVIIIVWYLHVVLGTYLRTDIQINGIEVKVQNKPSYFLIDFQQIC